MAQIKSAKTTPVAKPAKKPAAKRSTGVVNVVALCEKAKLNAKVMRRRCRDFYAENSMKRPANWQAVPADVMKRIYARYGL